MSQPTDNKLTTTNPRFVIKKTGIAARLENAALVKPEDVTKFPHRIGIVFDDSGSMSGEPIEKAHEAIDAFVKNCNVYDTALCLYPLNANPKSLTNQFADVAMYGMQIPATGGTQLYRKLKELLDRENITRAVAFSDGQPTDMDVCSFDYISKKIPIDTIFIGYGDSEALRRLSELTGGIYIHFKDASSLATNFKYLTPAFRGLLMNEEFKKKLERGEI